MDTASSTILKISLVLILGFSKVSTQAQLWSQQNSGTNSDLSEIFYVSDNTGWVFGDSTDILGGFATGIVLKSTTQGVPWSQQSMGTPVYEVEGSYFLGTSKGIAVGRNKLSGNGAIIMTTDGGGSWTAAPPQPERLVDVHFANSNMGWSVGRNDFVLRTTDGGVNWVDISASTGENLESVYFTSANNGYVVGAVGTIIHSVDSGNTWQSQSSGTAEDLNAVYFVNDSMGWTVGIAGTILSTNDSGVTWIPQNSGTTEDLMDVSFVNDSTGWAVGTVGTLLKTTNAGAVWSPDSSSTTQDIMSISMQSSTLGWFCGKNGMIYMLGTLAPVGIQKYSGDVIVTVYPNPARQNLVLELPVPTSWEISMYDITGRLVYGKSVRNSQKLVIERGNWKNGLYLVQGIQKDGSTFHQRVIFE